MRYVLFSVFMLVAVAELSACFCELELLNDETFERYDFIGHVRVTGIMRPLGPYRKNEPWRGASMVFYEIIDLYLGDSSGWFYENDPDSSCGMYIQTGEEWVISGLKNPDGSIITHSCMPSDRVRHKNGGADWQNSLSRLHLKFLREYCGGRVAPPPVIRGFDTITQYYSDNTLESMNSYLDGKLNGQQTLYYPNGQLTLLKNYRAGVRTGDSFYYDEDGCMLERWKFDTSGTWLEHVVLCDYLGQTQITNAIPSVNKKTETIYHRDGRRVETAKEGYRTTEEKVFLCGQLVYHATYSGDYETQLVHLDIRPAKQLDEIDF